MGSVGYRPTCGVICSWVGLLSWLLADSRLAAQNGGSAHRARTTLPNNTMHSPDRCCFNVGPATKTVDQHWNSIGGMPRVCWVCIRAYFLYTYIPPYSCPHNSCTRRDRCGSVVLSGCVYQSRPELANYQACVLTGHRVSESEMTMIFCLVTFLSKLL